MSFSNKLEFAEKTRLDLAIADRAEMIKTGRKATKKIVDAGASIFGEKKSAK